MLDVVGQWVEVAIPLGVTVGLIVVIRLVVPWVLRRIDERTPQEIDLTYWHLLVAPLCWIVAIVGVYATLLQLPLSAVYINKINVGLAIALTGAVVYGALRVFNAATEKYRRRLVAVRDQRAIYVGMVKKIVNIVVLVIAVMIILDQTDYEITPLLASLGIAGIAVGLALQDTLSNLFAGFYLMLDQPIRPGDYIQLDSGEEGFVEEIGWRNTRIRPWANNLIVIPNAKLAESVLTNWHLPVPEMSVYVRCGVSYHSDLDEVERVAIEVGREVMSRVEGTAEDWEPIVRFKEFGDSNINFVVVLRVNDPTVRYPLEHEYIKALFRRFNQEGIEISFPMRTVIMRSEQA